MDAGFLKARKSLRNTWFGLFLFPLLLIAFSILLLSATSDSVTSRNSLDFYEFILTFISVVGVWYALRFHLVSSGENVHAWMILQ